MTRVYGWKPDLPDKRDRYFSPAKFGPEESLPDVVDLSSKLPPCWDQGSLGACTAFAIGGAFTYERGCQTHYVPSSEPTAFEWFDPSFLHIYYCERAREGSVPVDAGAYIRDGAKVSAQCGIAPAALWPYVPERFAQKPPKRALLAALDNRVTSYARVQRGVPNMRRVLAQGDTVVFGISVYESFESDRVAMNGIVPLPAADEELLGGHAVLMVGYDHGRKCFKVRNSWGPDWGDRGHFWLPYEYVRDPDLSDDFWTLKSVTEG